MKVIPSPDEAAALAQLKMLRSDELPMVAAYLLVSADSPALRQVAGMSKLDGWLIEQVWPQAMSELGVADLSDEAAWDLAMSYQIASWRGGERSTLDLIRTVVRFYIENDYPKWAGEAGTLYGIEDELDGGWGHSREDLLKEAASALDALDRAIRERT
jgi:hypothetical protein